LLYRTLEEFEALQYEDISTDEEHSLLLDQTEASVQNHDNIVATQTLEAAGQNINRSNGIESTLSQLDCMARSPHLCHENDPGVDAFGLRDMHCVTNYSGEDKSLLSVQPSNGSSVFPLDTQNIAQCYGSQFQQETSLPVQNAYYETTDMTLSNYLQNSSDLFLSAEQSSDQPAVSPPNALSEITSYSYHNPNALFQLSPVMQDFAQPAISMSSTDPLVIVNKLQTEPTLRGSINSTVPYEHSLNQRTVTTNNPLPFSASRTTDSSKEVQQYSGKDAAIYADHQLFQSDISLPLSSVFDKNTNNEPCTSFSGTASEIKPIGFVPAVKGTTFKSGADTETETKSIAQPEEDTASKLATMARIQPSSTVKPQQQQLQKQANTKTETKDSLAHDNSETGNDIATFKENTIQPPQLVPGYPWPMPPYPGAALPYPYPQWPYGPPLPMMPMMPHPMMPIVPVPYWMPPMHPAMHPAMRMRPQPVAAPAVADSNEKAEAVNNGKTMINEPSQL